LQAFLHQQWQKRGLWAWLTMPLSLLVCLLAYLKRKAYEGGIFKSQSLKIPVIVVGNLSVGGAGKSPLVAHLAKFLQAQGYHPGILCRGYKGKAESWPQWVTADSDPAQTGDEPVMLAALTGCPVMAGPDRALSAQQLIDRHHCDVMISDDGFQHLKLVRDIDIVVIDARRGLGNRICLPSGPLREPPSALKSADFLVINGQADSSQSISPTRTRTYSMNLAPGHLYRLNEPGQHPDLQKLQQTTIHAIAGIGHPQRFFNLLRSQGFKLIEHAFDDHHAYQQSDLQFDDMLPIITTEKDAIKLAHIAINRAVWVLPVVADLEADFDTALLQKLHSISPAP